MDKNTTKEATPLFTLSISSYALIFLFVVAVFFTGIGLYAYSSLENAREKIQENDRLAANVELQQAISYLVGSVSVISKQISNWDEVFQQLGNPAYYSYWREYRLLNAGFLPDYIEAAEIYDHNGRALASISDSQFPLHIDVESLEPWIDIKQQAARLIIYLPIKRMISDGHVEGFLAVRLPFLETLLSQYRFRFIDPESFTVRSTEDQVVSLDDATSVLSFEIASSPEVESMMETMRMTVIQLAAIVGILCLNFYFLMVYLLGKPLVEVSEYIDKLLHSNPGSLTVGDNRLFPVAELEKVKTSLNKYHADLEKAHGDLDEKNQELWVLAHHDTLTGMLNRRAFENEWNSTKQLLRRRRVDVGLILFDVNHFKAINDSYGHQVGDDVLRAISSCIQKTLREPEKLYRIGGDEFAAIIIGSRPEDELVLSQRCIDAVREYDFTTMGVKETVRISCGVSHCQAHELDKMNQLQWQADIAVYQAKRPGVSQAVLFNETMADGTEAVFSSWISDAVYEAITRGTGIEIHYQPIINTGTRDIIYYEALLRIRAEGELVPPSHIFPVVARRQMELELDRTIIEKVQNDLEQEFIAKGKGVSINLSAESIAHKDVVDWLMPLSDFTQSYYIVIEVTETSLITQINAAARSLTILRKLGFKVALDDFGSGYSSLRYLTSMPVDIIKFDISLIQGMMDDRLNKLVQQMASMLAGLGYDLVAEGIESEELLMIVDKAGFNFSQGYLFGQPERKRAQIAATNLPSYEQEAGLSNT
jgi:diguanylate cyclase (GGDEF)-like protein